MAQVDTAGTVLATDPPHGGLTLGERIELRRHRRGLSRLALAELAGVSVKTLGRYERDEKQPVATTLGRLALALETSTDYLVGLRDDPGVADPDSPTRVSLIPAVA